MDPSKDLNQNRHTCTPPRAYSRPYNAIQPFESPSPFIASQFTQLVPAFPVNQVNQALLPQLGLLNQGFNSNVWNVPPVHQIFITPTVPQLMNVNQPQNSYNPPNNFQNNSINRNYANNKDSSTSHFWKTHQNRNFAQNNSRGQHKNYYRKNPMYDQRKAMERVSGFKMAQKDLRQILAEKRKWKRQAPLEATGSTEQEEPESKQSLDHKEELHIDVDSDTDWLEENMSMRGTKLNLDVTNLKSLAAPDANLDCWYIVADKDIYLGHLNFLYNLLNSDDNCHLMMPSGVLAKLKDIEDNGSGTRREVNRARRAVSWFAQLLDAGMAVAGDDPAESEDVHVLNCCQKLADQNHHVVLISNDNSLQEMKDYTTVPIFTIKELKHMLSRPREELKNDVPPAIIDLAPMQITIENDLLQNAEAEAVVKVDSCDQVDMAGDAQQSQDVRQYKSEPKCTADAFVQTEIAPSETSGPTLETSWSSQEQCGVNKNVQTDKCETQKYTDTHTHQPIEPQATSDHSTMLKRREIRLNRNASQSKATNSTGMVAKRQFKWRRRKTNTGQSGCPNSNQDGNDSEVTREDMSGGWNTSTENACFTDGRRSADTNEPARNIDDDNLESSESSSFVRRRPTRFGPNIILEETSTSGVISNTSADTESDKQIRAQQHFSLPSRQDSIKSAESVMYEVTDPNMEEYLEMRREEWVSRFVQIMEEVLTQVLQREPAFQEDEMPPPWTIHEATECIKIKFWENHNVVDTADRLADVLASISDDEGRMNLKVTPPQYMAMYSYGLNLILTLQSIYDNCEDLQVALERLSKLLNDIRHPMDTSHNDTLCDVQDVSDNAIAHPAEAQCKNVTSGNAATSTRTEDFVKHEITQPNEAQRLTVKGTVIRKSIFNNYLPSGNSSPTQSSKLDFTSNSPHTGYRNFDSQSLLFSSPNCSGILSSSNNSQKVVRTFRVCPEFEKKVKITPDAQPLSLNMDPMDEVLDYEGYDDEDDEYYKMENHDSEGSIEDSKNMKTYNELERVPGVKEALDSAVAKTNWNLIMQTVSKALLAIYGFCEDSEKELKLMRDTKNMQSVAHIQKKAEKSSFEIMGICQIFEKISDRESSQLEKLEFYGMPFRDVLTKCNYQAIRTLKRLDHILNLTTPCDTLIRNACD